MNQNLPEFKNDRTGDGVKSSKRIAISLVISAGVSLICWWTILQLLYNDSFTSLVSVFQTIGIDPFSGGPMPALAIGVLCLLLFGLLFQLFTNNLNVPYFTCAGLLYLLVLALVLFGKSKGIQEISLDPSDIFNQVIQYPTSVLLNIVLFIPVGLVVFRKCKKTFIAVICFILVDICIEAIQYLFALGIADIDDVILNTMGFLMGYLIAKLSYEQGIRLAKTDKPYWRTFVYKPSAHAKGTMLSPRSGSALAILVILICACFAFAYTFYDYESYEEWDDSPQFIDDEILSTLSDETSSSGSAKDEIAKVSTFTIEGFESNNAWLAVEEDDSITVEGQVSETYNWLDSEGDAVLAFTLAAEEQIGDVTVEHCLPLVLTSNSELTFKDKTVKPGDEKSLNDLIDEAILYNARANFSIEDGWLEISTLEFFGNENTETPKGTIDYSEYTSELKEVHGNNQANYKISESKPTAIKAYVDSYTEEESGSFITVRINDKLGSALITHSLNLVCEEIPSTFDDGNEPSSLSVEYSNGELKLIEP